MQYLDGTLLHKKQIKTHKGTMLDVVSILDDSPDGKSSPQVRDVTDFDGHVNGLEIGKRITLPVRVRAGVSDKGNAYMNFVAAGRPLEANNV
jgi:hypothetical protein